MHKYLLLSRVLEVGVVEVHEAVLEPSDPHLENLLILNLSGIAHKTNKELSLPSVT